MTKSRSLTNLLSTAVVTVISILAAIVFGKYAISVLYCLIFTLTLSRPWFVKISDMFVASMILDIYNQHIPGFLFIQCLILYIMTMRFRSILLNSRISFCVVCFFAILVIPESASFLAAFLFGSGGDLFAHIQIMLVATAIFTGTHLTLKCN